jgi:hypothetical protein
MRIRMRVRNREGRPREMRQIHSGPTNSMMDDKTGGIWPCEEEADRPRFQTAIKRQK